MTNENAKDTIRWIFYFEEGNVKSDVDTSQEDSRIAEFVAENPTGLLKIEANKTDIWVNLARVKCMVRTHVDIEAEKAAQAAEQEKYQKIEAAHPQVPIEQNVVGAPFEPTLVGQ